MNDVLAEIGGVKLTVRMAGAIAALLILILFMLLRMAMNKKAAESDSGCFLQPPCGRYLTQLMTVQAGC